MAYLDNLYLLFFNGAGVILLSLVTHFVGQAVQILSCYLIDMIKKIKFELRSGALPFTSFLSVCAPVLSSNNNKGDVYDR